MRENHFSSCVCVSVVPSVVPVSCPRFVVAPNEHPRSHIFYRENQKPRVVVLVRPCRLAMTSLASVVVLGKILAEKEKMAKKAALAAEKNLKRAKTLRAKNKTVLKLLKAKA